MYEHFTQAYVNFWQYWYCGTHPKDMMCTYWHIIKSRSTQLCQLLDSEENMCHHDARPKTYGWSQPWPYAYSMLWTYMKFAHNLVVVSIDPYESWNWATGCYTRTWIRGNHKFLNYCSTYSYMFKRSTRSMNMIPVNVIPGLSAADQLSPISLPSYGCLDGQCWPLQDFASSHEQYVHQVFVNI